MAMLIPAAQREMATSETLMQQFASPDWLVAVAALVIIYASMVPILKGCKDEDFYWFSVRAEKVNGRLAMLAWAGLLGLEYLADGACFF